MVKATSRSGRTGWKAATAALAITLAGLGAMPVAAQNLFAPVVQVNDHAITGYELSQRMAFMQALGSTGDIREQALEALINDRLQTEAATRAGFSVSDEELETGMAEFAGRGGLDLDQFAQFLAQSGIAVETFRDFVGAGLAWRKVVQARFGPITSVSDKDIRFAISPTAQRGGLRLLFSEIFLPIRDANEEARSLQIAQQIATASNQQEFAAYARQYSVAPSGESGGVVDWVESSDLPPPLAQAMAGMEIGAVMGPIDAGNAIALFQLRGVGESSRPPAVNVTVEYAAYHIAGGHSDAALAQAAALRARVQQCNDLYAEAQGQPEGVLTRETLPVAQLPQDIALELARLDDHEISTNLTRNDGQVLVFLMLCNRVHDAENRPEPDVLRDQIFNQRLSAQADTYLAELRANAHIWRP
ncbi:MAG: SurA N-terminal domain-containing protein [Paracoccaceae bacterium]